MPLDYKQIVGNQEDWANTITNVEMAETPFLDWLPVGDEPVNVEYSYQADFYRDPQVNSHVDGQPVSGFKSAGEQRGRLRSLIHYFSNTASATTLQQDVTNVAGVNDELAREITKGTKELSRDFEAAFLEDDDHREGNTTQGYMTRGVGAWVANGAQALYPVPADFRPPTTSISTTATAGLTENVILDILESQGQVTKSNALKTGFVGQKLKRAFNNMPLFTPASTLVGGSPTGATGVVYSKDLSDRAIGRTMERYNSDFGPIDLVISWFNVSLGGNAIERAYSGFFLHQKMWKLRWNQKPIWRRLEYKGGSHDAFCEAIAMLVCLNPKGEAKYQPTT